MVSGGKGDARCCVGGTCDKGSSFDVEEGGMRSGLSKAAYCIEPRDGSGSLE